MSDLIQYLRRCSLLVTSEAVTTLPGVPPRPEVANAKGQGLDLSAMKIKFEVKAFDEQSPNNASIRVYNLDPTTVKKIQGEFDTVILQAGYQQGLFGTIFKGTIKQYRTGRENATDTYLDILAADNDIGYNFGVVNQTLAAGSTPADVVKASAAAMGVTVGYTPKLNGTEYIRGKVLFGLGRAHANAVAKTAGSTWSVQNGVLQMIPLTGYLPTEAVVLNSGSGMIGIPEITDNGLHVRCLINPKLAVGGLIKVNNADINKLTQQNAKDPLAFNQYAIQHLANISTDGLYRVYVIEYTGDTRGDEWFADLICLAVQGTSKTVQPYG
jgi:baseplate hub protein gp41